MYLLELQNLEHGNSIYFLHDKVVNFLKSGQFMQLYII